MTTKLRCTITSSLLVILNSFLLFGTTVKPVNLSEMVEYADRVFYGRCVSAESKFDSEAGATVREYRFLVKESLKGVVEGEEVVIRQIQTMGSRGPSIPGIPAYHKGQQLLLFLHADSRIGLTSPVGMSQGTFMVRKLPSGEVGFVNPQKNRNLTHQIEPQALASQVLSAEQINLLDSGEPIPLNAMREMVRNLDELHEREGGVVK